MKTTTKSDLKMRLRATRLEFERQVAQAIRDCPSMTQIKIADRSGRGEDVSLTCSWRAKGVTQVAMAPSADRSRGLPDARI